MFTVGSPAGGTPTERRAARHWRRAQVKREGDTSGWFSIAGDVVGNRCDVTWRYLPRLTSSPSRNEAMAMVKTRLSGIDMDRNTGPFFSITQICR